MTAEQPMVRRLSSLCYIRHNPERVLRNATRQLERLGYSITLSPTAQTA